MTVKLNVCMNWNPTEEAVVNEIVSAYPELKGIAPESIKMKVNNSLTYTDDYTRYFNQEANWYTVTAVFTNVEQAV